MSIINEALAPCSKCGQQHKVIIYKSINTADNPELKAKVADGSLFLWECPHCGQMNLARYETLYHDPAGKLMVWLIPAGEISEAQMQAITMHTKAMGGYTLRRVNDMGTLMEKVLIAEAGLDDIVLEMCKYVTKLEMLQKSVPAEQKDEFMASTFHFYRCEEEGDERILTFMYALDGQMLGVNIGWNVYQDCAGILERNPQIRPEEGFAKIDAEWLASKMA
ncbi:MAG: CpXC domain-containing protein [Bacteroidales bacterium]|nr:CpXC domain-containing protein [Bacteroidales bacterium]MBO5075556.1 CpXC domain-containing protein [Bacteroidales bacterium]